MWTEIGIFEVSSKKDNFGKWAKSQVLNVHTSDTTQSSFLFCYSLEKLSPFFPGQSTHSEFSL